MDALAGERMITYDARGLVELAGWLPPELQDYEKFTWAMGVTSNAKEPATGETLVKFLSSPAAAALIKKKGMEPAAQ